MANFVLCKIAAQLQFCLPKLQWPKTGSKPIYEGLILCGRPYPQTSLAVVYLPQHKTSTSPPSKACYCQPQTLCIFDVEIKYILTNYKRQGITCFLWSRWRFMGNEGNASVYATWFILPTHNVHFELLILAKCFTYHQSHNSWFTNCSGLCSRHCTDSCEAKIKIHKTFNNSLTYGKHNKVRTGSLWQ